MTVAAVRRGDEIVVGQMGANADRNGLLTCVKMNETGNETCGEVLAGEILECANLHHLLVHAEQSLSIEFHCSGRAGCHNCLQTFCRVAARCYRCNRFKHARAE